MTKIIATVVRNSGHLRYMIDKPLVVTLVQFFCYDMAFAGALAQ